MTVRENEKPAERPLIFVSYSHKDEAEKDQLVTHLRVLQHAGLITVWNDDLIGAGDDWLMKITEAMSEARVAVLLITANFLTSGFILSEEVPPLLQRRKREGMVVFPIIAKASAFQRVGWLEEMNVRPKNGRPVWGEGGRHADEDLAVITDEIAAILQARIAVAETKSMPNDHGSLNTRQTSEHVTSALSSTDILAASECKNPGLSSLPPNPFIDRGVIHNPERFYGRREQIESVLDPLNANSVAIYGPPKIGKTSLTRQIAHLLSLAKPSQTMIFWSFGLELGIEYFLEHLFEELIRGSTGKIDEAAYALYRKSNRQDQLWCLRQLISGRDTTLVLDEFDVSPERGLTPALLGHFRGLAEHNPFRLMTASVISPKRVFPANKSRAGSPPTDFLISVELGPFKRDEAWELFAHRLASVGIAPNTAVFEEALAISGAHPFKLQVAFYHWYRSQGEAQYDWKTAARREWKTLL